jgi:hypothetical protein
MLPKNINALLLPNHLVAPRNHPVAQPESSRCLCVIILLPKAMQITDISEEIKSVKIKR